MDRLLLVVCAAAVGGAVIVDAPGITGRFLPGIAVRAAVLRRGRHN
jgi:hypothetical protein